MKTREIRNWDYGAAFSYYEVDDWYTIEDLYQAFKKRMEEEAKEEIVRGNPAID